MTHVTICTAYRYTAKNNNSNNNKNEQKAEEKQNAHIMIDILTSVRFWVKYPHENQCETKGMLNSFHFPV